MNRPTAKLMSGLTRLAFWRKPAASTPEDAASQTALEPATAPQSNRIEVESSEAADVPVLQASWLARLKQALHRRQTPAQEAPADSDELVATERPSPKQGDASATVAEAPAPQPSWLARLISTLRRPPKSEPPLEAVRSSEAEAVADEEAISDSRVQRLRAILTNKWVWVPGLSAMLVALIATMMWMLVQSGRETKQLQAELLAAQKQLKQAGATKQQVVVHQVVTNTVVHKPAAPPVVATTDDTSAPSQAEFGASGCDVSNKDHVTHNLKNCIESFNALVN